MAFEINELSGSLFTNDRKQTEKQPDLRGDCKIDGEEYWISGWAKVAKSGTEYLSLAFTAKDESKKQRPIVDNKASGFFKQQKVTETEREEFDRMTRPKSPGSKKNYDDDIPF